MSQPDNYIPSNHPDFLRLKVLFWKHLTLHQRILALSQIDMLSDKSGSALSLVHDLHAARQQDKLAELWNSITSLLPPEQREANPFPVTAEQDV